MKEKILKIVKKWKESDSFKEFRLACELGVDARLVHLCFLMTRNY